jgi:hypothetical protein
MIVGACAGGSPRATVNTTTTTGGQATTTTAAASQTTTTAPEAGPPLIAGFDQQVVLTAPTSGGGARPLLSWDPVDGAGSYVVFVYAPNGDIYWSWSGSDTSVHVGGEPQLGDGVSGPSVAQGMTWGVIAYDADLLPIAVSEKRPIAP